MSGGKIKNKVLISLIATAFALLALWYGAQVPVGHKFVAEALAPFTSRDTSSSLAAQSLSILVVGDIMLDRNVRNKIDDIGFEEFMRGVKELLSSPDITIGNLEGPFTTHPSKTASLVSKELIFTFDPALAPKLKDIGFDILGLANNHTYNFGREGFSSTKKYINEAGMVSYGDPNNKEALSVVTLKNGITIGIVGFHEFHYSNFDKVTAEIARIRPLVDFLIVTPHWGVEYQKEPTSKMRQWAHGWIEQGVDVVLGAHPHIIGDIEEYKNKKIFYSLGNFVFDQYFSKETSEGLAVLITLEKMDSTVTPKYTLTRVDIEREGVSVKND